MAKRPRPSAHATDSRKLPAEEPPAASVPARAGGLWVDHHAKQVIVFSDEILLNQLRRDGPRIEASFDALCETDLRELSLLFSKIHALLFTGLRTSSRSDDRLKFACAELLFNAGTTITTALLTLRAGYVLQPGILIRSVLEAVAMTLHLLQRPQDFPLYEAHTLQSTRTISTAKKVLPPLGQIYGYFSDNFAHIGHLHKSINPIREYTERHVALATNLSSIRMAMWLLYVSAELLFHELVASPRYWQPVPNGCIYNPSEDEKRWMSTFLGSAAVT